MITVPLPPAKGRSIGGDSPRLTPRGMPREVSRSDKTGENSRPTNGEDSTPAHTAIARAIAWATYLETHARRAYGSAMVAEAGTAGTILARIRSGDLNPAGFSPRDVWRPGWSRLTDRTTVIAGLRLLADYDWLATIRIETEGRPRTVYVPNPKAFEK